MSELVEIRAILKPLANAEKAAFLSRFFKTRPGQYGAGDVFLGITVPDCRKIARQFHALSHPTIQRLLASKFHEERLIALLILVQQYAKGSAEQQDKIYHLYLSHTDRINNWDLVDLSSRDIVGRHIYQHPELAPTLDRLAASDLLWDRRIAIMATFYFLQEDDPAPTLHIAEKLLSDSHDLIQKANGWMLRELGKRINRGLLIDFIKTHYAAIPRTTLRYAIEHFSPEERQRFLRGAF
jgi:3-methyladenine DNA glycosylase AlkD